MNDEDATVIACLDSADAILRLRDVLNTQLQQGWMEMARARYSMGHSRINESLFSMRAHRSLVCVSEGELEIKPSGSAQEEEEEDSSDDEVVMMDSKRVDPLCWFGSLVSPHLRASQQSFQKALRTLVEIANAQCDAQIQCDKVSRGRGPSQ